METSTYLLLSTLGMNYVTRAVERGVGRYVDNSECSFLGNQILIGELFDSPPNPDVTIKTMIIVVVDLNLRKHLRQLGFLDHRSKLANRCLLDDL